MPFTMSKCAKGAEKRKADDSDLTSSQAAPTKVPKVSEIKVEAPLARPRNPRSRPISAPVQVSFYKYSKNAGLSLSILFTSLSVASSSEATSWRTSRTRLCRCGRRAES